MTITEIRPGVELDVTPLSGTIGSEIRGVDLTQRPDDETLAAIRQVWLDRRVVFFPGQHLTPAQHREVASWFGEVTQAHPVIPGLPDNPEVFEIDYSQAAKLAAQYGDVSKRRGLAWHTDVTFVHNPPLGSILKAVEIPTYGGDTAWTNLVAAYDGLSQPLKELVDGLTAVHRNEILVELGSPHGLALRSAFTSSPYWTEHPVVRVHPETGEKALFVNPNFTSHVVGLRNKESRALLDLLYAQIAAPRYTVRFRWAPGSIAFWDNRATAHLAALDAVPGEARVLHRITIRGDVPVGPGGFESRVLEGGAFS